MVTQERVRVDPADAAWTRDLTTRGREVAVVVTSPTPMDRDAVLAVLARLLVVAPGLHRRVVWTGLPFGVPYWAEEDTPCAQHLHEDRLAAPGDDAVLAARLARVAALPRGRAPWDALLLGGYGGGSVLRVRALDSRVALDTLVDVLAALGPVRVLEGH